MVADTLTQKEIKRLQLENQELKNKKPIIVTKFVTKKEEKQTVTENANIKEDSIQIIDFYPKKDNPFIKYVNRTSLSTGKGIGNFTIYPIEITGVINEREDGLYDFNLEVPNFISVGEIDVQALPLEKPKKDNFGILVGGSYGINLETDIKLININSYLRFQKFYIGVEGTSQGDLIGGIKVEF